MPMPEDDWIVFTREPFVIAVNQLVSSGRGTEASEDCHELQFQFTPLQVGENGMPSKDTQALYNAVEDRVTKAIEPTAGHIVAMRTGRNSRTVWICGSRAMVPALEAAISAIEYFEATLRPASLSDIKALHPTVLEAQLARRSQLLHNMVQLGDDLSAHRKTSHFIYGVTSDNRLLIEGRLKTLGFQLDPNRPDIQPEAFVFFRFSSLEPRALDNDIRAVSALCDEFGCEYDGWDTDFVKSSGN